MIIDEIATRKAGIVAGVYFSFQTPDLQDLLHFKYSLMMQVSKKLIVKSQAGPENTVRIPTALSDLFDDHHPSRHPPHSAMDAALLKLLGECGQVFVVVDALDEMPKPADRILVLKFLDMLCQQRHCTVNVLVTSRPEEDIRTAFDEDLHAEKLQVQLQNEIINADISRHLATCVKEDPYRRWSDSITDKVIRHLTMNAEGVFRWADLQFQDLRGKAREKDIDKALKQLPKTLQETYQRMLDRITVEGYADEAVAVLRWLYCAKRPLKLSEAVEIMGFEWRDEVATFREENLFPEPANYWVRIILAGLVEISQPGDRETQPTVSFAHFSVREFLESAQMPHPMFQLNDRDTRLFVCQACLAYVADYGVNVGEGLTKSRRTYPLLLYACVYFYDHAEDASDSAHQVLETLRTSLSGSKSFKLAFVAAIKVLRSRFPLGSVPEISSFNSRSLEIIDEKIPHYLLSVPDYFYPIRDENIFQAARDGAPVWVKLMIDDGISVNVREKRSGRSPLSIAVELGHKSLTEMLLHWEGIDLLAIDYSGRTLLSWAMSGGNISVVSMLSDKMPDQAVKTDVFGQTVIHWAVNGGSLGFLEWLFSQPSWIKLAREEDHFGWAPLAVARSLRSSTDLIVITALVFPGHDVGVEQHASKPLSTCTTDTLVDELTARLRCHQIQQSITEGQLDGLALPDGESLDTDLTGITATTWNCTEISVSGEAWYVEFSHDGKRLISGGEMSTNLIALQLGEDIVVTNSHDLGGNSRSGAWAPDDSSLIICERFSQIRMIDMKVRNFISFRDQCLTIWQQEALNEPQNTYFVGARGFKCSMRPLPDGTYRIVLGSVEPTEHSISDMTPDAQDIVSWQTIHIAEVFDISGDSQWLVAGDYHQNLWVYRLEDRKLMYSRDLGSRICFVDFGRGSRQVLIRDVLGQIKLFDVAAARTVRKYDYGSEDECVLSAKFGGKDDSLVVAGGIGKTGSMLSNESGSWFLQTASSRSGTGARASFCITFKPTSCGATTWTGIRTWTMCLPLLATTGRSRCTSSSC